MILARVLKLIRQHFPNTHILVRGDGHFSNPELMQLIDLMPNTAFIFGLAGNARLLRSAESKGSPKMGLGQARLPVLRMA